MAKKTKKPTEVSDAEFEELLKQETFVQKPVLPPVDLTVLADLDRRSETVDRVIHTSNGSRYKKPPQRSLSRKYFAVNVCRVGWWVPERPAFYETEIGVKRSQQASGFDAVAKDLTFATVSEMVKCCPPGYITVRDKQWIEDISALLYPISLDKLKSKSGTEKLPQDKADRARAHFIHVTCAPHIEDGFHHTQNVEGAEALSLPPTFLSTVYEKVVYVEVPDGTPGSYNPDDYTVMALEGGDKPEVRRTKIIKV